MEQVLAAEASMLLEELLLIVLRQHIFWPDYITTLLLQVAVPLTYVVMF